MKFDCQCIFYININVYKYTGLPIEILTRGGAIGSRGKVGISASFGKKLMGH